VRRGKGESCFAGFVSDLAEAGFGELTVEVGNGGGVAVAGGPGVEGGLGTQVAAGAVIGTLMWIIRIVFLVIFRVLVLGGAVASCGLGL